jgi:hypothetical protein
LATGVAVGVDRDLALISVLRHRHSVPSAAAVVGRSCSVIVS